jgi:hypothetical protein
MTTTLLRDREARDRVEHWRERLERTIRVVRAPRVLVNVYGDEEVRTVYRIFTAPHPRFPLTAAKRWGVALLGLPDTFDQYLAGRSRTVVRQKRRLAEKQGYRYGVVSPARYLDQILEINTSAPVRQGRPMPQSDLDPTEVAQTLERTSAIHGVFDSTGRVRAYAVMPVIGDAVVVSVILGHADHLEHGVMYLLVSEAIRSFIEVRDTNGAPSWVMYDTIWGAPRGLAYFKARLGFKPYTVDWKWSGAV